MTSPLDILSLQPLKSLPSPHKYDITNFVADDKTMSSSDMARLCDSGLALSISSIMATSSTPSSPAPGGSSPVDFTDASSSHLKASELEPPIRPKSTPFPQQDIAIITLPRSSNTTEQPQTPTSIKEESYLTESTKIPALALTFSNLPHEIHEYILDHIFGVRASILKNTSSSRGWSSALRHSRRKQLSDVALISKTYRGLVQSRIFKHIKVQGTRPSIDDAINFFTDHPHLRSLPRHIEVWSPVWERRAGPPSTHIILPPETPDGRTLVRVLGNEYVTGFEHNSNVTSAYCLASRNSSLYEIFKFVQLVFPEACVLTLEGGHCKKPPKLVHFPEEAGDLESRLPKLDTIRTLVLKSAWNIMRTEEDFQNIMLALPNIREWHSSYAKPKSKSYLNISKVVSQLPTTIRHLNISLEGNYSREALSPAFWRKIYPDQCHICLEMAKSIANLESFTYCGRVCHQFFDQVSRIVDPDQRGNSSLKSLDVTVKNCCRRPSLMLDTLDGSGINDPAFIAALESLVISGIRSLSQLTALTFLRIRFVDLESPMPLLNPFFLFKDNQCSGLWSEEILATLSISRPTATFCELSDDFGGITYDKDGKITPGAGFPKLRPRSMKVSSYEPFSNTAAALIAIN